MLKIICVLKENLPKSSLKHDQIRNEQYQCFINVVIHFVINQILSLRTSCIIIQTCLLMEEFGLTVLFRVNLTWILAYLVSYWHLPISLIVVYDYYNTVMKAIFNLKKSPFASAKDHLPSHDTGLPASKNIQQWRNICKVGMNPLP